MSNDYPLRNLDLNLLLALHALLDTGSVSESARALHVGQPAASHMLKRLRELLKDPLLRRQGRNMVATPFALELKPRLKAWLEQAAQLVQPAPAFDPATATGTLRLSMPDLLEATFLPPLLQQFLSKAPGVSLTVAALPADEVEVALTSGLLDAALGYFPSLHATMGRELLFKAPIHCFYSTRHLRFPHPVTLSDLTTYAHIFTTYIGQSLGAVDRELHRLGLSRRIIASTASMLAIAHILERIPAVAMLPDFVEGSLGQGSTIRSVPVLGDLPGIPVEVIWNPKSSRNELRGFFLDTLRGTARFQG